MDSIGSRIRGARECKGLSQEAVARALDLSSKTIIRIEHSEYEPSVALVRRIAAVLEGDADFLLTGRRAHPCATIATGHADPLEPVRTEA